MRHFLMHKIAKYTACTPEIYLLIILLILNHFWCFEHWRAELGDHSEGVVECFLTYIKIDQFNRFQVAIIICFDDYILRLNILMAY